MCTHSENIQRPCQIDREFNFIRFCSAIVEVYDVHGYDGEYVLTTQYIGLKFSATGGCASGECVGEILSSETQNDAMLKGNEELV